MANPLLDKPILVLDGGLGTTLEDVYDVQFSHQTTPLWSSHLLISSHESLIDAQKSFVDAGADILLTATYQASERGFQRTPNFAGNARETMLAAVNISRAAFSGHPGLVALSLGAYGATMIPSQEYTGDYEENMKGLQNMFAWHYERAKIFTSPDTWKQIDVVAFETLPRLSEISAAQRVMEQLQQEGLSKPYWISCVFPNEEYLPDGSTIEQVLYAMMSSSQLIPYAIGINCTKVGKLAGLIGQFEEAAQKLNVALPRLVVYPDGAGGQIYDTTSQKWIGDPADSTQWVEKVFEIVEQVQSGGLWEGILVGGCCKTGPAHIWKLKQRLHN